MVDPGIQHARDGVGATTGVSDAAGSTGRGRAGGLPRQRQDLIGRDHDIHALCSMLESDRATLITLTGPGGVGKTQLAIAVAARCAGLYAGGCWFIDLSHLRDPDVVTGAIAQLLGLRALTGVTPLDQVQARFANESAMLLLDNLEQIDEVGVEIAGLLERCPLLTVLATSRVPLRVSVERRYPVPPLALPGPNSRTDAARLRDVPSVRLFERSAQAVDPAFSLNEGNVANVAAICARLDGVPLAIELAAARCGILSPSALLARLDRALPLLGDGPRDAPPRLRSLEDAIGWSYDLLDPKDQAIVRRLAVFAGGFTADAARAVAFPEDSSPEEALASLISLAEHNLLIVSRHDAGEVRFDMLATIREYGLAQLERHHEVHPTRDRHVTWIQGMMQHLIDHWGFESARVWRASLTPEQDNLRAALAWLVESGDRDGIVRLAGRLAPFWRISGQWEENATWLRQALAWSEGQETHDRLTVLAQAGVQWVWLGDEAGGTVLLQEALAIAERLGEDSPLWALAGLGLAAQIRGDFDECAAWYERALAGCEATGQADLQGIAEMRRLLLTVLGWAAFNQGDLDRATTMAMSAFEQHRVIGLDEAEDAIQLLLGVVAAARGKVDEANRLYQEALELAWSNSHLEYLAAIFTRFAEVDRDAGNPDRAAMLLGATARLQSLLGGYPKDRILTIERVTSEIRSLLGESTFTDRWEAGRQLSLVDAVAMAREVRVAPLSAGLPPDVTRLGITPREFDVLCLLSDGRTDQEIADALYLSRRTVNTHVGHLLAKLQVSNRREAIALARTVGLLTCCPSLSTR